MSSFYFLIFLGFTLIGVFRVNFIFILMLLELILLSVFCFIIEVSGSLGIPVSFFFLLGMVCMGGYGVSLLVFSTRFWGKDSWGLGVVV